jgi:hypothetical protein
MINLNSTMPINPPNIWKQNNKLVKSCQRKKIKREIGK